MGKNKRVKILDIINNTIKEKKVTVSGWVRTKRQSKNISFLSQFIFITIHFYHNSFLSQFVPTYSVQHKLL